MSKKFREARKVGIRKYWFSLLFPRAIREVWDYLKRDLAIALLIIVIAITTSILSANGILDAAIANGYLSDASSLFRTFIALVILSILYLFFSVFYYPVILYREQESEKGKLRTEIEEMKAESNIQPVLDNEEPQIIDSQIPGVMVDNGLQYSPRMAVVYFFNKPKQKSESTVAKKVDVRVSFYDKEMKPILSNIVGQWDIKPEWELPTRESGIAIAPTLESRGSSEVDFEPSQDKKHSLVLAFWHVTDKYMYAVSSESFRYKNLRNPQYELQGKDFYIQIVLHPAYSNGIERWFLLSHDLFRGGLEIKSVTNKKVKNVKGKTRKKHPLKKAS